MLEFRLICVLALMFLLPGGAILTLTKTWQRWPGLQGYLLAASLGISVYPIFFYFQRFLPFNFTLGPYKCTLFLVMCLGILLSSWKSLPSLRLEKTEWFAVGIFFFTLLTRWWVAYTHPYPAWTDSIHHVMLTELIATQGRLPHTLEPYYPVSLDMYHLGLHSLAAVVAWLAQAPFYSALLWTSQTLNGLCGIGVYLVLDRKVGRLAAIVGAAVVGLFSFQPAFYVNWGRFTQVASQAILLVAWLVTYETIQLCWTSSSSAKVQPLRAAILLSSLLTAGVYLLHYRVAAIYLLLLLPSMFYLLWQSWRVRKEFWRTFWVMAAIGVLSLLFIFPALWPALKTYVTLRTKNTVGILHQMPSSLRNDDYYTTTLDTVFFLTGQTWLLWLAGGAALIGLLARCRVSMLNTLWIVLLCLLGNTYRLGIPLLNVINLTGIVIMFYLPISVIIGSAAQSIQQWLPQQQRPRFANLCFVVILLLALPAGWQRIEQLEPFRYFITPGDLAAMEWIRNSTPIDARFAVNTDFWNGSQPHGTDAGYWIPYLTGRKITAGAMLLSLGTPAYQQETLKLSDLVKQLHDDAHSIVQLYAQGVDYIYVGANGNYTGKGLDAEQLRKATELKLVYAQDGVSIFQILPSK